MTCLEVPLYASIEPRVKLNDISREGKLNDISRERKLNDISRERKLNDICKPLLYSTVTSWFWVPRGVTYFNVESVSGVRMGVCTYFLRLAKRYMIRRAGLREGVFGDWDGRVWCCLFCPHDSGKDIKASSIIIIRRLIPTFSS